MIEITGRTIPKIMMIDTTLAVVRPYVPAFYSATNINSCKPSLSTIAIMMPSKTPGMAKLKA